MKKLLHLFLCCTAASAAFAAETTDVDYSHSSVNPTLTLVWSYETNTCGSVTYAIITGVRGESTAYPSGAISIPTTVYDGNSGYIVKEIADGALSNQIGITSVSIPLTTERIGEGVFSGCTVLGKISVDSANPWFASTDGLLYDKDGHRLIACPSTVEAVSLPSTLSTIGSEAFANCHRLTTITVPASVTTLGRSALINCSLLESLYFKGDAPAADTNLCTNPESITIYKESSSTGWDVTPWTSFKAVRDATVSPSSGILSAESGYVTWKYRIVGDGAELYNNGDAVIPTGTAQSYTYDTENKKWIGDGTLAIPSTLGGYPVTRIGNQAFRNCSAVTSLDIPASVTYIGDYAFENCNGVEEISLPNTLTELGKAPFAGSAIQSLNLPIGVNTLHDNPVAGCQHLTTLTVDTLNRHFTAANNALYNRDKNRLYGIQTYVEEFTIPATTTWIASNAFSSCTLLKKVTYCCNAPVLDDGGTSLYADVHADLTSYAAANTTGWNGDPSSTDMPETGKWPLIGPNQRKIVSLYTPGGDDAPAEILTSGDWRYRIVDGGVEIWNYGSAAYCPETAPTAIAVPTTIDGLAVVKIGACALANFPAVTTISIPTAVREIDTGSITNLPVLASITVADGNPFYSNSSEGVLYDKDFTTLLRVPTTCETIDVPNTVTSFAENAFAGCHRLKTLNVQGGEPAADDGVFADTPADMTTKADAYATIWANPIADSWKGRPFVNTSAGLVGAYTMTDDSGCTWSYTVDTAKLSLGAYGETPVIPNTTAGEITIPEKLSNRLVTEIPELAFANCGLVTKITIPAGVTKIAASAFNGCTSLVEIAVASDNPNYCGKYRCLYSKDGSTLVRVPAATRFAASQTQTTTAQKKDLIEVLGAIDEETGLVQSNNIIVKKTYGKSTSTTAYAFTPAITSAMLLAGVTNIADYAFTDCGKIAEGTSVSGTLTTKTNGKLVSTLNGTFPLPFSTDDEGSAETTNNLSAAAGFYKGSVCLYRTVKFDTLTYANDVTLTIPAAVTAIADKAFEGAHFTSVSHIETTKAKAAPTVVMLAGASATSSRATDCAVLALTAGRVNATNGECEPVSGGDKLTFYVGISQNISLDIAGGLEGALNSVTAKGLPTGLRLVKTALRNNKKVVTNYLYSISGTPTRAQVSKAVTLTASNKYKWSGSLTFEIEVLALPAWIAGSYNGVRYDNSANAYGAASATLTSVGRLSGKFLVPSDDLKTGKTYSFSAASLTDYDADSAIFLGTATMKIGRETFSLPFTIARNDDETGLLTIETDDGEAALVQNIWNRKDLTAPAYAKGSKVTVDGITYKLGAKGIVSWSGKVEGDNGKLVSVSGTSQLLNGSELLLYIPPKTNLLGGICEIVTLP